MIYLVHNFSNLSSVFLYSISRETKVTNFLFTFFFYSEVLYVCLQYISKTVWIFHVLMLVCTSVNTLTTKQSIIVHSDAV